MSKEKLVKDINYSFESDGVFVDQTIKETLDQFTLPDCYCNDYDITPTGWGTIYIEWDDGEGQYVGIELGHNKARCLTNVYDGAFGSIPKACKNLAILLGQLYSW